MRLYLCEISWSLNWNNFEMFWIEMLVGKFLDLLNWDILRCFELRCYWNSVGYHKPGYPDLEGEKRQRKTLRLTIPTSPRPYGEAQSNEATSDSPELWPRAWSNVSPEPWPRAQSTPRPSPGLERNQRLARALVSAPGFPRTMIVLRTWHKPCLLPCYGRRWPSLFQQLPSLLRLIYTTVSMAGQRKGWEMLTHGAVVMPKQSLFLAKDRGQGLGKDCHDPEQGSTTQSTGTTMLLPLPQGRCNTLGVKHALSLSKAMHKHSH